jgi:hypothetical protein
MVMDTDNISVVINYCSNDEKFIKTNITNCLKFSNNVIVVYCTHLLNGFAENIERIKHLKDIFPEITLLEIKFDVNKDKKYHHNLFRWEGKNASKNNYVLFLDADEIVESDSMVKYLDSKEYLNYDVVCFECFWYYRDIKFQSITTEQCGALYKKSVLNESIVFNYYERWKFIFENTDLISKQHTTLNGKIFVHHLSWVKNKKEMLLKVATWAHQDYENYSIAEKVEEEFSREFINRDFVHGYKYNILEEKNTISLVF